jgi:hypothetical protein
MSSNIRVFVQWKDSTVFAGEDIECTITFKNVAVPDGRSKSSSPPKYNGFASGGERQRKLPAVHSSTRPSVSRNSSYARGHGPALSIQTTSTVPGKRSPVPPSGGFNNGNSAPTHRHGRSLSIYSMGTDTATEVVTHDRAAPSRRRGHGRAASLQVVPGRPGQFPSMSRAG